LLPLLLVVVQMMRITISILPNQSIIYKQQDNSSTSWMMISMQLETAPVLISIVKDALDPSAILLQISHN